ncbi:MAG: cytochrome P450 [Gammaproteobacteria bacterium]|nr:cytochrome P450 [Gammaproteobacteria bacterium]
MSGEPIYYDPWDYKIDDNPYELFKRLRDEAPIWHNDRYDFWVLSRYEDLIKASLDTETYSSRWGTVLDQMSEEPSSLGTIIYEDPPYHDQLRGAVASHFSPANISKLGDEIREIVVGYLEPLEGRSEFDFVEDFCRWVPMDVISVLLGVPEEERKQINDWGNDVLHRDEGQDGPGPAQIEAMQKSSEYFTNLINLRRENPQDDLASLIATGKLKDEEGERPLTQKEAIEMAMTVGLAGNETAARLLASFCWLLAKHPEQRQMLRDDPRLIPRAIEEVLRFEPPSPVQFRRVMKDVELHGTVVPEGSKIGLLTASANRDERQYEDAEVFNIERKPARNVALGYGIHSCLGASVARLETRIAMEEVLKRIPDWDVDWDNMVRVRTSTVRGYSHVPIRITQ